MTRRIKFSDLMTIEQRKAAINNAMESAAPFHLKRMVLSLPENLQTDYTGGTSQMLLARAITIEFEKA